MATKTKAKKPTFVFEGKTYLAEPDMDEFLVEAGLLSSRRRRAISSLKKEGIEDVSQIMRVGLKQLEYIDGIPRTSARKLFIHSRRIKNQGELIQNFERIKLIQEKFQYLPTGSASLDRMLHYPNGRVGWRTNSVVELYGPISCGKTQICMTASAMCMEEKHGWSRDVLYIDTDGSFDVERLVQICDEYGVDEGQLQERFFYAHVDSLDELEIVVDTINNKNLGMIIIDSLITPLETQYRVSGDYLRNFYERNEHLKQLMHKIRLLTFTQNLACIYTNQIEEIIGGYGENEGPRGGLTMGYQSNIRIKLGIATMQEHRRCGLEKREISKMGVKLGRADMMNCAYLAPAQGFYIIGPKGISDPDE